MEPIRHGDSAEALTRLGLTPRESDVALAILGGLAVKEIAGKLFLSPHTVTDYMKNIFYKLDVSSRSELAALLMGSANPSDLPIKSHIINGLMTNSICEMLLILASRLTSWI